MMANQAAPFARGVMIGDNDVLLGRGRGASEHVGNKLFLAIVDQYKIEYNNTESYKKKGELGRRVYQDVEDAGGRFLQLVNTRRMRDVVEYGTWRIADKKPALEKCKQALREKRDGKSSNGNDMNQGVTAAVGENAAAGQFDNAVEESEAARKTSGLFWSNGTFVAAAPAQDESSWKQVSNYYAHEGGGKKRKAQHSARLPTLAAGDTNGVFQSRAAGIPIATSSGHQNIDAHLNVTHPSRQLYPHDGPHRLAAPSIHARSFSQILPSSLLQSAATSTRPPGIDSLRAMLQEQEVLQMLLSHKRALNSRKSQLEETMTLTGTHSAHYHGNQHRFQSNTVATCPRESASYKMNDETVHSASCQRHFTIHEGTSMRGIPQMMEGDPGNQDEFQQEKRPSLVSEADEEAAVSALAALMLSGRETFTEEEAEIERATMTDAEKVAALCDLFGKYGNVASPEGKRARRDLDDGSIQFLINQMKMELDLIPSTRKTALSKALKNCSPSEFCDARLEHFLRCQSMNPKLAAERFVEYWESRCELFGPDKYLLPMTLGGALQDDLEAIGDGVLCLLPCLDLSGRQLLFLAPARRSRRASYSSESLLRALWYVMEVASLRNDHVFSSFVRVTWCKDATIWDYDRIYERFVQYEKNCFPLRRAATHVCCPSLSLGLKVVKPVINAVLDKRGRARMLYHLVSELEILDVLAGYGIPKECLPCEMGGEIPLNQLEWMADRRAIEMEEL